MLAPAQILAPRLPNHPLPPHPPAPGPSPQDVLVVTAPGSGAEIIPFLKTWVNLPMAIGFTVMYTKASPGARGRGWAQIAWRAPPRIPAAPAGTWPRLVVLHHLQPLPLARHSPHLWLCEPSQAARNPGSQQGRRTAAWSSGGWRSLTSHTTPVPGSWSTGYPTCMPPPPPPPSPAAGQRAEHRAAVLHLHLPLHRLLRRLRLRAVPDAGAAAPHP